MAGNSLSWIERLRQLGETRLSLPVLPLFRSANATHRNSLLQLLLFACDQPEKLIPQLVAMAANEKRGQQWRINRFVTHLRNGRSWAEAAESTPGLLNADDLVALRTGIQMGVLPLTIRHRLDDYANPARRQPRQNAVQTAWYIGTIALMCTVVSVFVSHQILPKVEWMHYDANVTLPSTVKWFLDFSHFVVDFAWVGVVGILLVVAMGWSQKLRSAALQLPLIRQLFARQSNWAAEVLDELAIAKENGRPYSACVSTLARYHGSPKLRHQLLYVRNELDHGADLWEVLNKQRFLDAHEYRAVQVAQASNHDASTLHQLAASRRAQCYRRWTRIINVVQPLAVLLMGVYVLLLASVIFASIYDLSRQMASP